MNTLIICTCCDECNSNEHKCDKFANTKNKLIDDNDLNELIRLIETNYITFINVCHHVSDHVRNKLKHLSLPETITIDYHIGYDCCVINNAYLISNNCITVSFDDPYAYKFGNIQILKKNLTIEFNIKNSNVRFFYNGCGKIDENFKNIVKFNTIFIINSNPYYSENVGNRIISYICNFIDDDCELKFINCVNGKRYFIVKRRSNLTKRAIKK